MENATTIGKQIKTNNMIQVWINKNINGPVDSHEYDIDLNLEGGVGYTLYRSNSSEWTDPGEEVATLKDDGDGIFICHGDTEIRMDYHEADELLALLLINYQEKMEFRKTQTVKSI